MTETLCACGCGTAITQKRKHRYTGSPRFVAGHNLRGVERPGGRRAYVPTPEEAPSGLCECGCGGRTEMVKTPNPSRRHFKGYPLPFLPHHMPSRVGDRNPRWKGGRTRDHAGYMLVLRHDHPEADPAGYVREHRLVMEEVLGRPLRRDEFVHHVNGVKDDNRPENLVALTKAEHNAHHAPERKYDSETMRTIGKRGAAARWDRS